MVFITNEGRSSGVVRERGERRGDGEELECTCTFVLEVDGDKEEIAGLYTFGYGEFYGLITRGKGSSG